MRTVGHPGVVAGARMPGVDSLHPRYRRRAGTVANCELNRLR
jgi:hypothetical protein